MIAIDPTQFVLTTSHGEEDRHRLLAFHRTFGAAMEAYEIRYHQARHHEDQPEATAREEALYAAIAAVGRSYAATALNQVAHAFAGSLDEVTVQTVGDIAATLDLAVVEDLTGANGTAEEDQDSDTRVFRQPEGWTGFSSPEIPEACTTNYAPEFSGRPPCTATAVWKAVEFRDFGATASFWCDNDLPAEFRKLAPTPGA